MAVTNQVNVEFVVPSHDTFALGYFILDDETTEALTRLFLIGPTVFRKDRKSPRKLHPDVKL